MEERIKAAQKVSNRVRVVKTNWPAPIGYLGGGVFGRIFITNNGRLMKIQKLNASKEFNILKHLKQTGISPGVKNGNIYKLKLSSSNSNITRALGFGSKGTNSLNMFIMNRVGTMTLKDYYRNFPPSKSYEKYIHSYIKWLVNRLQKSGVEHRNLHKSNIVVAVDSKGHITRMWIIDFGKSRFPISVSRNVESYMKTYRLPYTLPNNSKTPKRRTLSLKKNSKKKPNVMRTRSAQ